MNGSAADGTLHLPRIMCLHGGGVNADAFRLQSRALIAGLRPHFRLVFADGPFLCDPGPGIVPVYADFAPFRRWLRWLPEHQEIDADTAIDEIWYQLNLCMDEDNKLGATGDWVGLLGFSQGAKVSASLLFDQQKKEETLPGSSGTRWRFAVLLAGRAPLVALSEASAVSKALVSAADISEGFEKIDVPEGDTRHVLTLPTVHVHGLQDPGLHLHRRLLHQYCEPKSSTLVEWDGNHRVPIKSVDVKKVIDAILDVASRTGVSDDA
jgi:Serine hydrolase (FSH1)